MTNIRLQVDDKTNALFERAARLAKRSKRQQVMLMALAKAQEILKHKK